MHCLQMERNIMQDGDKPTMVPKLTNMKSYIFPFVSNIFIPFVLIIFYPIQLEIFDLLKSVGGSTQKNAKWRVIR